MDGWRSETEDEGPDPATMLRWLCIAAVALTALGLAGAWWWP